MASIYFETILISFCVFILIKIVLLYAKNKKLPPSPPRLPFIGHLHLVNNPLHHSLALLSQRYGPATFLRFGSRPVIVITSNSLAEQCLTTHDLAFANRPQFHTMKDISFNYTVIAAANYGPYWRKVRRIAAVELLSTQSLLLSSNIRAGEIQDTARELSKSWETSTRSKYSNGLKKLELRTCLFKLTINVVMMMIAGKRFYGDNMEDLDEIKKFRRAIEQQFDLDHASNIEDFIPVLRLLDLNGVIKKRAQIAKQNKEMMIKLIEEHKRSKDLKKKTMMSDLLELQKNDPEGYNDETILSICMTLLLGGTDTTSNTVEWAMSHLLNNQDVLKKVADEIDLVVGNERLVEESDMANLPFLHCILSEVLRLYPGGALLLPREAREDVTIQGYNIPRGTILLVNTYYIHRDPNIWEEPTKFKPERFENGKADGKWMIPFGMGRRRCPGESLAMRNIGLILATLIQCFEWERTTNELVDLKEGSGFTLTKATPLEVMYRPREPMLKLLSGI